MLTPGSHGGRTGPGSEALPGVRCPGLTLVLPWPFPEPESWGRSLVLGTSQQQPRAAHGVTVEAQARSCVTPELCAEMHRMEGGALKAGTSC